jgi:hypothetical protein
MERAELLQAVKILAACLRSGEVDEVGALVSEGFALDVAHRLAAFVPSAFARPPLERLGIRFSDEMSVKSPDGRDMHIVLAKQPEFVASLALAREHYSSGILPADTFETIVDSSAEVDVASKALNEGADIEGRNYRNDSGRANRSELLDRAAFRRCRLSPK